MLIKLLIIIVFIILFFYIKSYSSYKCNNINTQYCGCFIPMKKNYNPSIISPKIKLGLVNFNLDTNIQMTPPCNPIWYSIRYVNINNGEYSNLSPWSDAIYSGGSFTTLDNRVLSPINTCPANRITIGTQYDLDYDLDSSYRAIIFRQEGDSPNSQLNSLCEGIPIGYLLPSNLYNSKWMFSDICVPFKSNLISCPFC